MRAILLLLGLLPVACGAGDLDFDTLGERGQVKFSYDSWQECLLGCGLDRGLMTGASAEIIAVGDGRLDGATVRVWPGGVATVADVQSSANQGSDGSVSRTFTVSAYAPGVATLELAGPDGTLIDLTHLRVRDAACVRFDLAGQDGTLRLARQGTPQDTVVEVLVSDKEGDRLVDGGDVTDRISDMNVAVFIVQGFLWKEEKVAQTSGTSITLRPLATGTALVTSTTPSGVSGSLTVIVE